LEGFWSAPSYGDLRHVHRCHEEGEDQHEAISSCARSCGSATISELGHVDNQCVAFDACGPNCEVLTITFDDGSTLVMHESIVGVESPGNSSAAGTNAPEAREGCEKGCAEAARPFQPAT